MTGNPGIDKRDVDIVLRFAARALPITHIGERSELNAVQIKVIAMMKDNIVECLLLVIFFISIVRTN